MGLQFFKSKNSRPYDTTQWDARLLSALVECGRSRLGVRTLLEHRQTKIDIASSGPDPIHEYVGQFRIWLDDESHEYRDILVKVGFDEPHEYFNRFINDFEFGYFCFDHLPPSTSSRASPAFSLTLKNRDGLSEAVAKLFADTKAMGSKGVWISWSIDLARLEGLTATQAWGDWSVAPIYDDQGKRINELPPGCGAFPIESLSFEAAVL